MITILNQLLTIVCISFTSYFKAICSYNVNVNCVQYGSKNPGTTDLMFLCFLCSFVKCYEVNLHRSNEVDYLIDGYAPALRWWILNTGLLKKKSHSLSLGCCCQPFLFVRGLEYPPSLCFVRNPNILSKKWVWSGRTFEHLLLNCILICSFYHILLQCPIASMFCGLKTGLTDSDRNYVSIHLFALLCVVVVRLYL